MCCVLRKVEKGDLNEDQLVLQLNLILYRYIMIQFGESVVVN